MSPRISRSESSDNRNYPTRRNQPSGYRYANCGQHTVELVALEGGRTRSGAAWDEQCARAARVLRACDDDVEQATGVLRMLATAPLRRRRARARRAPAAGPESQLPAAPPKPPSPGPEAWNRGRDAVFATLLALSVGCLFVVSSLGLLELLTWIGG